MALTLDSAITGNYQNSFSMDAFRNANKFELFITKGTAEVKDPFFSAYYQGNFAYNIGLQYESYANVFNALSGLFSGNIVHSTLQSASGQILGTEMSGAFDAPLKPFIQGTKPLNFEIETFLPLIVPGTPDNADPFERNIMIPINTLLRVCVPDQDKITEKVAGKLNEIADKAQDFALSVFEKSSPYWSVMNNIVNNWRKDFFNGAYMLTEPIQFAGDNTLKAKIAGWTIDRIIVTDINVSFSPLIYSSPDGSMAYPSYAKVTLSILTKDKAKLKTLGVGTKFSPQINDFLPQSEKANFTDVETIEL